MFAHRLDELTTESSLDRETSYAEQAKVMHLYAQIAQTLRTFDPAVYTLSPATLAAATSEGGGGGGLLERRRLRNQARSLWRGSQDPTNKPNWDDLHQALDQAAKETRRMAAPQRPRTGKSQPTPRPGGLRNRAAR